MSGPFGSSQWMYNAGGDFYDYSIDDSLRFDGVGSSPYLSRAVTHNRKTFTVSFWLKRGSTDRRMIYGVYSNAADTAVISFENDGHMSFYDYLSGYRIEMRTNMLFRDVGAWYHVVWAIDTTQATASNRMKLYVNGEQITSFSTATYPSQNLDLKFGGGGTHAIGTEGLNVRLNFSGYFSNWALVAGQQLDASYFGEFKSGIWIPKNISGLTYGTGGYLLEFAGNANDTSGNGNNWTANNISAHDYVIDSPTNNFANISPLTGGSISWLENGNLQMRSGSGADAGGIASTFGMPAGTGKWYWEIFMNNPNVGDNYPYVGVCANQRLNRNSTYGTNSREMSLNCGTGGLQTSTTYVGSITSVGTGLTRIEDNNILGVAIDMENRKMWFSENGVFPNSGNPATGANPTFTWTNDVDLFPHWFSYSSYGNGSVWNYGQEGTFAGNKTAQGNSDGNGVGDFYYSPPSGFLALCTANLPAPAIDPAADDVPEDYFNTVLYTGVGGQSITGVGFQPDWVWIKSRNVARDHKLTDVVRGVNKELGSQTSAAEVTRTTGLTSFDSDGFTVGSESGYDNSGDTFVAWNWKANGSGSSNTDGSVTSTVSVNQEAGFSILTYAGAGTTSTVGHGLAKKPNLIIIKNRTLSDFWLVQHGALGATKQLNLGTDAAAAASSKFNNTEPTSSVFTVANDSACNASGSNYVAYCFADIDGYSKFGSYTGNGSSDGAFVYTGFRPAWIMIKASESTGGASNWRILDSTRDTYNAASKQVQANTNSAEESGSGAGFVDILSNGFKLRTTALQLNSSGKNIVYMAFAEQPFKYANAR